MKSESTADTTRRANSLARQNGWGRATTITTDPARPEGVVRAASYCWRKKSDGSMVNKAYAQKAWSRTYYSHAHCTVNVHPVKFELPNLPAGKNVKIGDWARRESEAVAMRAAVAAAMIAADKQWRRRERGRAAVAAVLSLASVVAWTV